MEIRFRGKGGGEAEKQEENHIQTDNLNKEDDYCLTKTEEALIKIPEQINKNRYFSSFIKMIDKEINKLYKFYIITEKELYVGINSKLYKRNNYDNFDILQINKEIDELTLLVHITLCLCKYLDLNMNALKLIFKKFNKKYFLLFKRENVLDRYLSEKLSKNSHLSYILSSKIIDEASVIIEDVSSNLVKTVQKLKKNLNKQTKDFNRSNSFSLETNLNSNNFENANVEVKLNTVSNFKKSFSEALINTDPTNKNSKRKPKDFEINEIANLNAKEQLSKAFKSLKKLNQVILKIDESNYYRINKESWNFYIKHGTQIINNYVNTVSKEEFKSIMAVNFDENLINKFLPNFNFNNISTTKPLTYSTSNKRNIIISLFHTFYYMMAYSIVQPTNAKYMTLLNTNATFSGLIMAFTPLAGIISTFAFSKWTNYSYKTPMIISLLLFVLGNLLYAIAFSLNSLLCVGLGRFIIGLANGRIINRRYLIQFVGKDNLLNYSLYYVMASSLGVAAGPLFASILILIKEFSLFNGRLYFNEVTYPGWFCFLIAIIFLLIIIFSYSDPKNKNFKLYQQDGKFIILL